LAEFKTEYLAAYGKGREEADQELKAGRATIYASGQMNLFEHVDRETGLPYKVIAGCGVDGSSEGREAGHNDRIHAYTGQRGLPPNSFKRWDRELFDLNGHFEFRCRDNSPLRLTRRGPAAKSLDGRHEIRILERQYEKDDGTRAEGLAVAIFGAGDGTRRLIPLTWNPGQVELVWGPEGSRFAIVRGEEGRFISYIAVDLMRGESLREEHLNFGSLSSIPQIARTCIAINMRRFSFSVGHGELAKLRLIASLSRR
jgi:hypothetical protein